MKFSAKLRRGFTLIELLIVIVIIGILAVGLVPKVIDAPKRARDTVRKTEILQIKTAIESYYADKGKYPGALYNFQPITGPDPINNPVDYLGIANYFQGGKLPMGPDGKTIYRYVHHADTCYEIAVIMETANAGNVNLTGTGGALFPPDQASWSCAKVSQLKTGVGTGYYIAGGSF